MLNTSRATNHVTKEMIGALFALVAKFKMFIGQRSLFRAICNNDAKQIELLLINGADPNETSDIMHVAAQKGNIKVFEMLITAGGTTHIIDTDYGNSIIHHAAFGVLCDDNYGCMNIIRSVLQNDDANRVDPFLVNFSGKEARDILWQKDWSVAELLFDPILDELGYYI